MGMIAVKCPSCGADLQLDDSREFGFCNFCGTKVVQDKVVLEHRGSVKIDNTEYVEKFLLNAHRALAKEDWEEVEKYYNLVEQNAPDNIEAVFFSAYGKAMLSLTDSDYFKRQQKFNVLNKSMEVISDYYETTSENKEEVLRRISQYINNMYKTQFVYQQQAVSVAGAINAATGVTGSKQWCVNLLNSTKTAFVTELRQISEKHNEPYLQELINENTLPVQEGGCYVATAVYGSYDCPQVWTLRRYRDYTLAETWYGRTFIRLYYAISPSLVKWFGHTKWFKKMWKGKLDHMVESLNKNGVESTPYTDKSWR